MVSSMIAERGNCTISSQSILNTNSESHKDYIDVILHGLPSRCLRDDAVPYFSESAGHDGWFREKKGTSIAWWNLECSV